MHAQDPEQHAVDDDLSEDAQPAGVSVRVCACACTCACVSLTTFTLRTTRAPRTTRTPRIQASASAAAATNQQDQQLSAPRGTTMTTAVFSINTLLKGLDDVNQRVVKAVFNGVANGLQVPVHFASRLRAVLLTRAAEELRNGRDVGGEGADADGAGDAVHWPAWNDLPGLAEASAGVRDLAKYFGDVPYLPSGSFNGQDSVMWWYEASIKAFMVDRVVKGKANAECKKALHEEATKFLEATGCSHLARQPIELEGADGNSVALKIGQLHSIIQSKWPTWCPHACVTPHTCARRTSHVHRAACVATSTRAHRSC